MAAVNPSGLGAPRIELRNSGGGIITDTKGRPIDDYILSARYQFIEDEDNDGIVVIKTEDVDLPDIAAFAKGAFIKIRWGYIAGKFSPFKTLVIDELDVAYKHDGIIVKLICVSSTIVLKRIKQTLLDDSNSFWALLQEIIDEYNLKLSLKDKDELFGKFGDRPVEPINSEDPSSDYFLGRDNTSYDQIFESVGANIGAARSTMAILREHMARIGDGPWVVNGDDDELTVKNRDLGAKLYKTYKLTEGTGELLSFHPVDKTKSAGDSSISSVIVDSEHKRVDWVTGFIDEPLLEDATDEEIVVIESAKEQVAKKIDEAKREKNLAEKEAFVQTQVEARKGQFFFNPLTGRNEFAVQNRGPLTGHNKDRLRILRYLPGGANGGTTYTAPEMENIIKNAIADEELHKFSATAILEGDPSLRDGQVINILNVAKRFSGRWYIEQATHRPHTKSGYKTELKMIKDPPRGVQYFKTTINIDDQIQEVTIDLSKVDARKFKTTISALHRSQHGDVNRSRTVDGNDLNDSETLQLIKELNIGRKKAGEF